MTKVFDKFEALNSNTTDPRVRRYLTPKRVVLTQGNVTNPEAVLLERTNQITLDAGVRCTLRNVEGQPNAAILVDFGIEFPGSCRLMIWNVIGRNQRADILVRFGESVSEAMTPLFTKNAGNDHAIRDRVMNVGFLSSPETNESGYRFAYIELLEPNGLVEFKAIQGVFTYRDLEYKGSFDCSDPLLTKIWDTAAYTAHVNMQEYLWDGIKRDRLVWIGDMHTEINTILAVFGYDDIIAKSLDLVRDETPVGRWMNNISSYTIWWLLMHVDLYRTRGNLEYLKEQRDYLCGILEIFCDLVDENGSEKLPDGRLLDWPNHDNPKAEHAGFQGLLKMALDNGAYGNNFVKTMMRIANEKGACRVVCDQRGNPTNAADLAHHLLKLLTTEEYGVYHGTGNGECSWYEFTKEIVRLAGIDASVTPISTDEFPTPAKRPAYSALDNMMFRVTVGDEFRPWQEALECFIKNLDK